jgi:host factor-I protein
VNESQVKTHLPLQDAYLLAVKRENAPVTIYLRNGFQLRGYVRGFDNFTIILEYDNKPHLVYKHAVSTVSPQAPVQFSGSDLTANVAGNSAPRAQGNAETPSASSTDGASHSVSS